MSPTAKSAIFVLFLVNVLVVSSQDIATKFSDRKIVPNIIPKAPTGLAKVSYPNGKAPELGTKLNANDVKEVPSVSFTNESGAKYVVLMFDPNPNNTANHTQHWLVTDVQPNTSNNTLTEYVGVLQGQKGTRQFVVLVYKLSGRAIEENHLDKNNILGRVNFNVNEFAKKYSLGDPVAGNFFDVNSCTGIKSSIAILFAAMGLIFMFGNNKL
ncbi:protein D3-like [Hyposmocoma kahamanoa]|uniref:protein D3-like n=1 Tax=Hyposmocoma kahamanoa TaxID=1477025 RepID=UPI000E6D60F1|nr:protein D3-like [Hyposmocoma kahamanoa]